MLSNSFSPLVAYVGTHVDSASMSKKKVAITEGEPRGRFKIAPLKKAKVAITEGEPKGRFKIAPLKKVPPKMGNNLTVPIDPPPDESVLNTAERDYLQAKIAGLKWDIAKICSHSGTPGLSLGILYEGQPLHYSNFGYADLDSETTVTEHSVFEIDSVGKFITSYALGLLVAEGKLKWNDPIKLHLKDDFKHWNSFVERTLTVVHCLSHSTGLVPDDNLWRAERARMNLNANDTLTIVSDLKPLEPPGTKWRFNNWGYAIAGKLIEKLTGQTYGTFLKERIFDPMKLNGTTTNIGSDNTVKGYMAMTERGEVVENGLPPAGDSTCQSGATGIKSCVYDLLLLYKAVLDSYKDTSDASAGPNWDMLTRKHVDLGIRKTGKDGTAEQSYSLGWIRTELPGIPSANEKDERIVGVGEDRTMLWHHNGHYPGYMCASYLLPDTKTAIVVLTNSTAKFEVPDIIAQMALETILDTAHHRGQVEIDWVGYAAYAARAHDQLWKDIFTNLLDERPNEGHCMPLDEYVGKYYNSVKNWYMEFWYTPATEDDPEILWMCMQGRKRETVQRYQLHHFYQDVFFWVPDWDENAYKGRYPISMKEFYLLKFEVDEDLFVTGLRWNSGDGDYLFPKEKRVRY